MKIKKITMLLVVTTMIISTLAGCGTKDNTNTANNNETQVTEETNTDATDSVTETTEEGDGTVQDEVTEVEESTETSNTDDTVTNKLYAKFEAEVDTATDLEELANSLLADECFKEVATGTMVVEPGFLSGFEAEITGFNNGVMFSPMIGTIPFVGYLFETDDTDALVNQLTENYQLNWNICTTADEMLVKTHGNYVFFVMSPYSFGE